MAEPGTIKVGDTVTHPAWEKGTTRKVVSVAPLKRHPKMKKAGYPENSVELDSPAHEFGVDRSGIGEAELLLDRYWMEAGLEVVSGG